MPSIKRPGLEVIQEIRTRTPTFFRSTFPPAVIGPCYQIIDATTSTGALNTNAQLSLPASVTGDAAGATFAVGAKRVRVKVNGANDIEVTLSGTAGQALTIATVVSKLNEGFAGYLVFAAVTGNYIRVRTVSSGDSASIQFLAPSASEGHTLLGFKSVENFVHYGTGDYDNHPFLFPYLSLPDTRGIINYLTFTGADTTIYRVQSGSPIALSEDSCINWNRQSRMGIGSSTPAGLLGGRYYDVNNGTGTHSGTGVPERGPELFYASGHVDDAAGTTQASVASTRNTLTGHQAAGGAAPLNQYLYPYPTGVGSTTNKLLSIGRHASLDLLMSDSAVDDDYYHFEAYGFQLWAADSTTTRGSASGAFGNKIHFKFSRPEAAAGFGDDGVITIAAGPETQLSSATYNFDAQDAGKYVYLRGGTVPGNSGAYLIASVTVGPPNYAVLTDAAGTLIADAAGDISFCRPADSTAVTLPQIAATKDGTNLQIEVTYATTATRGCNTLSDFDTAMQAATSIEKYVGCTAGISYLGTSATSTNYMAYWLQTKEYFLQQGADPVNFGTQNATYAYASCLGEVPLVESGHILSELVGKTLTLRLNGGPVQSHTLTSGNCTDPTTLAAALNSAFYVDVAAATNVSMFTAYTTPGLGTCYIEGTGSGADVAADWVITDAQTDFYALGVMKGMHVWVYGANVPGDDFGMYATVQSDAIVGSPNTITLNAVSFGTITAFNYKILVPGSAALGDAGNKEGATLKVLMSSNDSTEQYAGVDSCFELGGDAIPYLLGPSPYATSSTTDYNKPFRGDPFPITAGDGIYENGTLVGTLDSLENYTWDPGLAFGSQSLTNAMVVLSSEGATVDTELLTWYATSEGIESTESGTYTGTADKPMPEVIFSDSLQTIWLKGGLARNSDGIESTGTVSMTLLAAYTALRKDITAQGASPAVQLINSYDELSSDYGPISPSNPFALGVYFAQLNATFGDSSIQVKGLGVDAVSTNEPYGTIAAYTRALALMQTSRVYAMSVMTHSDAVHDLLHSHITTMSSATGKSERVGFICQEQPTEKSPTLCGTDTTASVQNIDAVAGTFEIVIDPTGGFTITAALTGKTNAAGGAVPTFGTASIPHGIYIRRSGDSFSYSVSEIKAGNILECRTTGFAPGYGPSTSGNDDLFYSSVVPGGDDDHGTWDVDGETVSLYIRQATIDTTTSTGKGQVISAMTTMAGNFADRRMRFVQPDTAVYQYSGVDTTIPGFYMTSALAGRVAARPPQESFTRGTIAGIDAVQGSWDAFSEEMMDTGAGGGIWWMVQNNEAGAVYTRHQLTTDVSSNENKEASVTHVLDYISERVRLLLSGIGGKYNLTPNFLAYLSMVVNTICSSVSGSVVQSCIPGDISIDETEPDAVNITLNVRPWSIGNYIRVRIVV